MKRASRVFLLGTLTLVLLTAACAEATPTTIATSGPIGRLASPTPLGTNRTGTPLASPDATLDITVTAGTATPVAGTTTTETAGTANPNAIGASGLPVTGGDLT